MYRLTEVALESAGSVSDSRRRISAGEVARTTSSPSVFSKRICLRSTAMRRSRNHQIASSAPARINAASSTGGWMIQPRSSTITADGLAIRTWKN